ncbi:winged helix DNA-binding domain-containing protein [Chitinophaga horti]|uniref:Winged helix DNA-binding domain-containing protein n=1 Tax=Chitinophaga horti TaxID=2920382 RepID=A0ABY6IZL0_9BACT|nr:winged helix DNA-binding domain-containing protein [Chitinophaga horti]UYQ92853.1 winged helix DNA-binding domain-containing protein [Chitinophaga horti]
MMTDSSLLRLRLHAQLISQHPYTDVADVVHHMGAMQAQDYAGAKWSVALRMKNATDEDIELAIAEKLIVRTWSLRGTLHFVAPTDVRWMTTLLRDRLIRTAATYNKMLGLDEKMLLKGCKVITKALGGGKILTRDELSEILQSNKLPVHENRLSHYLNRAAFEQLICFGPRKGKAFTFTLLDDWVPVTKMPDHETQLANLASRYLNSRGPASVKDFTWWSGLPSAMARAAIELVKQEYDSAVVNDETYWFPDVTPSKAGVHLLPGFDEYLLGYAGRSAVVDVSHSKKIMGNGNAVFAATIVVNGKVVGTWKRSNQQKMLELNAVTFEALSDARKTAIRKVANAYGKYMGLPAEVIFE